MNSLILLIYILVLKNSMILYHSIYLQFIDYS
jgi:hypothetical protein